MTRNTGYLNLLQINFSMLTFATLKHDEQNIYTCYESTNVLMPQVVLV